MPDKTELKPCAHCGSYNVANVHITSVNIFRVECNECGADGGSCSSKQKAVAAWNRRQGENIVKAEALEDVADNLFISDYRFKDIEGVKYSVSFLRQQAAALRAGKEKSNNGNV